MHSRKEKKLGGESRYTHARVARTMSHAEIDVHVRASARKGNQMVKCEGRFIYVLFADVTNAIVPLVDVSPVDKLRFACALHP